MKIYSFLLRNYKGTVSDYERKFWKEMLKEYRKKDLTRNWEELGGSWTDADYESLDETIQSRVQKLRLPRTQ